MADDRPLGGANGGSPRPDIRIFVDGHVDDLYSLALLFPEGVYAPLHVVTALTGAKDGLMDRVTGANSHETYVTGAGCSPLLEPMAQANAGWIAAAIIGPLNGYATLADSNFNPVEPRSVTIADAALGIQTTMSFGSTAPNVPRRAISVASFPTMRTLMPARVDLMADDGLALEAATVIAGRPSWGDYYRLLEDIADRMGTSLAKLFEVGVAERKPLKEFTKAANNRRFGRHGAASRDTSIPQETLMNLLEAREFVRRVVSAWLDHECGGRLPRIRVDGGPLRFGLDQ